MLISYAQNREDLYLYALLGDGPGFYVDIGANHPTQHSVTQFFYDRGWHGINIEPNSELACLFDAARPRDINLNVGISDRDGSMTLRVITEAHGLSTFDRHIMDQLERAGFAFEDRLVEVTTLLNVLTTYATGVIDFLKIDTEGHEMQVLEGNDWLTFRPRCLVLEGGLHDVYIPYLRDRGYRNEFFDGLNFYFVDEQSATEITIYKYAERVLSQAIVPADLESQVRSLTEQVAQLRTERDTLAASSSVRVRNDAPPRVRLQRLVHRLTTYRKR